MQNKVMILDCDGVLYPTSMLSLKEFVDAMKTTYRDDFKIDGAIQEQVSKETIAKNHLGMFNYINALCEKTGNNFDDFCYKMQEKIDYSKITRDDALLKLLLQQSKQNKVVILTNNHMAHLDKVLQQRFGKTVFEMQNLGIECFDIKSTMKDGVFYPKQNPKSLEIFADRLGVLAQDCILIDDTQRNLDSAKQVGMDFFLIDDEKSTLKHYLTSINLSKTITKGGKQND